jgi:hypothetical protein
VDNYNKTFQKTSPVETEIILPHASAEVVHPHEMEPFAAAEVIDPQDAEESSITIVKPTKVIYANTSLRIDITTHQEGPNPSSEALCDYFGVCKKVKGITTQG